MKRVLLGVLFVLFLAPAALAAYLWLTWADVARLPELRSGDIVFHTDNTSQTLAIMMASGSLYTHTGIIKISEGGEPYVVEAVGPVREVSLDEWIHEGLGGRLTVMRVRDLSPEQAADVLEAANSYYGKPYDPFFTFDTDRIYCSELVYNAFQDGAGLALGRIQTIGELQTNNRPVQMVIARRWSAFPPCQSQGIDTLESCLPLIHKQELITPVSLSQDERLEVVFSNY